MHRRVSLLVIVLLCFFYSSAYANTGVFFGAGSQVIPIKNKNIQLVRENVSIKLRIDNEQGKWGIPFFPRADVEAVFELKNTSDQNVNLQVGFPFLDLQGFGDEKLVLSKLDFRVNDSEAERDVTLKEGVIEPKLDPDGLFRKVFTWDEQFQPNQTKTITVRYRLLMGVASANSLMRDFDANGRKYIELDKLFPAISYSFGYITKTAYTWKEPVEKAVFTLDCTDFFRELEKTDLLSSFGEDYTRGLTRPVMLFDMGPSYQARDSYIFRWEFSGKVPEDGINASFIVLFIPALAGELPSFLAERTKPTKDNVSKKEYQSVLMGYYTRILKNKPKGESPFVKKYFEPVGLTKSELFFDSDRESISAIIEKLKAIK